MLIATRWFAIQSGVYHMRSIYNIIRIGLFTISLFSFTLLSTTLHMLSATGLLYSVCIMVNHSVFGEKTMSHSGVTLNTGLYAVVIHTLVPAPIVP